MIFVNKVAKVQSAKKTYVATIRQFCFMTFKYMEFHKP